MIMINPAVQIVRLDLKIIMVFDELNMFKMYYTLGLFKKISFPKMI